MVKLIDELGNVMDFEEVVNSLELHDVEYLIYIPCKKCKRKVFTTYDRLCKECFNNQ